MFINKNKYYYLLDKMRISTRRRSRKYTYKRSSYRLDYVRPLFSCKELPVRPYSPNKLEVRYLSSSPRLGADSLGVLIASLGTSYTPSFLGNHLGAAFILLMGLASTLFFVTASFSGRIAQDPSYEFILQRLDLVFLLYESFI